MGIVLEEREAPLIKRVIHTTADFDYARSLTLTGDALENGLAALRAGSPIVTDTNMARAGINRAALEKLGCQVYCFMADSDVAQSARQQAGTRAAASMRKAAALYPDAVYAIGNAPTALLELERLMREDPGFRPSLVIGAPVGFVNVVESKELLLSSGAPAIVARGRKGGSNVAAALCNALLYMATDTLDPRSRCAPGDRKQEGQE